MELNVTDDQLTAMVSAAILRSLDEEARNAMITEAIKHLMEPPKDAAGRPIRGSLTTMQLAFEAAVSKAAAKIVHEMVESDEAFVASIKEKLAESLLVMESKDWNKTLGLALGDALSKKYER